MVKTSDTYKERSERLIEFKKKTGLPSKKEISELLEGGFGDQVLARIEIMERYATAQEMLYRTMSAANWKVANTLHNIVDLQGKLWELEEELRLKGENPLTSPEWVKARELLGKEVQFAQRHGLDAAKFQHDLERKKERDDEDNIFTVEANEL